MFFFNSGMEAATSCFSKSDKLPSPRFFSIPLACKTELKDNQIKIYLIERVNEKTYAQKNRGGEILGFGQVRADVRTFNYSLFTTQSSDQRDGETGTSHGHRQCGRSCTSLSLHNFSSSFLWKYHDERSKYRFDFLS
jgi:hypothetical protein